MPSRSSGYLRWESKATAYVHRGAHILLFSPDFVEVRTVRTGKLVQVIEGADVRLVYAGLAPADTTTLIAMKGLEDGGAVVDKLMELVETAELNAPNTASLPGIWDEFDNTM